MTRPNATFASIELAIAPDPGFTARFGAAVRDAGGDYTAARGRTSRRYVTIPLHHEDLIDAVARAFPAGPKLAMVARGVSGTWKGMPEPRVSAMIPTGFTVSYWRRDCDLSPIEHAKVSFERNLDKVDWATITRRWEIEDRQTAERKRVSDLGADARIIKEMIAAEALRILDGANDIDELKQLAQQLREVCSKLGIQEPSRSDVTTDAHPALTP